jgi:hypothetical protein
MIEPKTLTLSVGIIALTLFACVSPSPMQPAGGLLPVSRSIAACPVGEFIGKVHFLDTSSSFSLPGSGYGSPPPIDPSPIPASITQDLASAYNAAPDFFKGQLCGLTGIYIDPTGCSGRDPSTCGRLSDEDIADASWGFRQFPRGEKYIGTSLGLWKNGGHAPPFSEYETRRLRALLTTLSPSEARDPHPPVHRPGSPMSNTATTTVLAALAHEYGHALWFDTFVVKTDGTPNPGGPAVTGLFCGGAYYTGSWQDNVELSDTRWVDFGDIRNRHKAQGINIDDLRSFIRQGNFPPAGNFLQRIYSSDEWASLLAAFSPDEDFVETYQLYVLLWSNPNLSSPIDITGTAAQSYDVPGSWLNRPKLRNKMSCFGQLPPASSPVQPGIVPR